MYKNNGLRYMLSVPWIYGQFQNAVGARRAHRWMASNYWRLKGGEKVVDVGCGVGVIIDFLPPGVTYLGFDISESYIKRAQQQYGSRGTFIVSTASALLKDPDPRFDGTDLILCNGLLHHLNDDESLDVLRLAHKILKPGGRLVCIEPCRLVRQQFLSGFIMDMDRGNHVRQEREWKALVGRVFKSFSSDIATAVLRLPYVHIIIECRREA